MTRSLRRRIQALDDRSDSAAVFGALEQIERGHASPTTRAGRVAADVYQRMQRLPFTFEDELHKRLWTRLAVTGETLAELMFTSRSV